MEQVIDLTFRKAYYIYIFHRDATLLQCLVYYLVDPSFMMPRRITRQESLSWWCDIGMPDIRQD